jgi:hypothetical protein
MVIQKVPHILEDLGDENISPQYIVISFNFLMVACIDERVKH